MLDIQSYTNTLVLSDMKFIGRTAAICIISFALCLFFYSISADASTPPAVLPNLQLTQGGVVNAMVLQTGGKLIIGGDFTSVNGMPRNHIARLNTDGSVDAGWNLSASGPVTTLLTNGSGLFVMGSFTNIGGLSRNGLARINLNDGTVDATWNPNPNSAPSAIAVSGEDVFVSGFFTSIGGQTRYHLAKIGANGFGDADLNWNPGMDNSAGAMTISGTNLYIGGYFYQVGGLSITSIARLNTAGSGEVDPVWKPPMSAGVSPTTILVNETNVYVAGCFSSGVVHGVGKISIFGRGAFDTNWNPNPSGPSCFVRSLVISGTYLYVGGDISAVGGQNRRGLARIDLFGSGTADPAWNANLDNSVSVVVKSGADLYVGGSFGYVSNSLALGVVKLDLASGRKDSAYSVQAQLPGNVSALALQGDGRLLVGGRFDMTGDVPRRNLLRVKEDGSLDLGWAPSPNGKVTILTLHSNELFVAGFFSQIGAEDRNQLAKVSLFGNGNADPDWNPRMDVDINSRVNSLSAFGTNLFVGGSFANIGGQTRSGLAKLSTLGFGDADPLWNPSPSPCCSWFLVESVLAVSSNLFVSGVFTKVGGLDRRYIAKLSTEGTGLADVTWNPNPNGGYVDLLVSDGVTNLFVSGGFTNIGGQNRSYRARLNAEGTGQADPVWHPGFSPNTRLLAVSGTNLYAGGPLDARRLSVENGAVDPNWNPEPNGPVSVFALNEWGVYVGGDFTLIGGVVRNGLAYFNGLPLQPILRNPSFTNNSFLFEIAAEPDQAQRIQTSPDLISWFDLTNVVSRMPIFTFTDNTNGNRNFFRLVSP